MPILLVVAHPDDEVLGCGAFSASAAQAGRCVTACILSGCVTARTSRPSLAHLRQDIVRAHAILGLAPAIVGDFPNLAFNTVPHLELVQFIEQAIIRTSADVVFTHHVGDPNDDHVQTSRACQAAIRLFQRRSGITPVSALYFMEVLSSTDWSLGDAAARFVPDTFFDVGKTLPAKLAALRAYRGVMRPDPHPRSARVVRALAHYRGGQSGLRCSEAFQTAFRRVPAPYGKL